MRRWLGGLLLCGMACASSGGVKSSPDPKLSSARAEGLKASGAPAQAAESFRERPPAPGPAPELVIPKFQKETLPNGLTVIVSERHDLPLVALGVAFAAGSSSDPNGSAGLAHLAYDTMLEGAGDRDALALDNAFADLGSSVSPAVSHDGAAISTRVLARNAEAALALLADIAQRPKLLAKDFTRVKGEALSDLAQRQGDPRALAQDTAVQAFYGAEHPYGHPSVGTSEAVSKIALADVQRFVRQRIGPRSAALVATGDVTLAQAKAWAEKYFGGWKGDATPPSVPAAAPLSPRERVLAVPKQGVNQTVVMIGRPAVPAGDPAEYELELASTVFGGFFGSRLNMNLREAKGYSYGAYAYLDNRLGPGPLVLGGSVRADVTGPAMTEIFKELRDLKTRPITAAELEAAREGAIRSLPGAFESVEALASAAARLFWLRQPMDRYATMVQGLERADAGRVQSLAESYFDPQLLRVVLVGDPQILQSQVASLGLGQLEFKPVAAPKPGRPPGNGRP